MLQRLRSNFRLSIITLLGLCAMLGITPFAIYRFWQGQVVAGVADLVILAAICSVVAYAWITDDTRRSGLVMAVVACGGAVVVAMLLGEVGLFWMFPPIVTSFFLTSPRMAMLVNAVAMAILLNFYAQFQSLEMLLSFVVTALVVSTCAYLFAVQHESQRRRLANLATLDPLTGVRNRRSMEMELQAAVHTRKRNGIPFGLALLDLDYFKRINDDYGHAVGDEVLVNCVDVVVRNIRQADQLFRFGGEEFVLLLPGVDGPGMQKAVAHLQHVIRSELRSPGGPVTASFGLATLRDDDTADSWLERADQALYQAKEQGRDRVVDDSLTLTTALPA